MGSINYNIGITGTDTEAPWVQTLVDYITGLDSRITCANVISDEYDSSKWEEGTEHIPRFSFYFNGVYWFTIFRESNLASQALAFRTCYQEDYGSFIVREQYFCTTWRSGYYWERLNRDFHISHIVTDDFIMIGTCGTSTYVSNANFVISISDGKRYTTKYSINTNLYTKANIFNISAQPFTDPDGVPGTFISRFSYKSVPGKIDYVKSSVYMNNGEKVFAMNNVYDCTTVTIGDPVPLSDGVYYAIGTHQLVKVING